MNELVCVLLMRSGPAHRTALGGKCCTKAWDLQAWCLPSHCGRTEVRVHRGLPRILPSCSQDLQVTQQGLSGTKIIPCSVRIVVCADAFGVQIQAGWSASPCALTSSGRKDFLSMALSSR